MPSASPWAPCKPTRRPTGNLIESAGHPPAGYPAPSMTSWMQIGRIWQCSVVYRAYHEWKQPVNWNSARISPSCSWAKPRRSLGGNALRSPSGRASGDLAQARPFAGATKRPAEGMLAVCVTREQAMDRFQRATSRRARSVFFQVLAQRGAASSKHELALPASHPTGDRTAPDRREHEVPSWPSCRSGKGTIAHTLTLLRPRKRTGRCGPDGAAPPGAE
jgi:hypothetical protein